MSEKKNLLKAEEAKKLAQESNCQLNRIAKAIEDSAKENRDCLYWCVYDTDKIALDKIIKTLNNAEYFVETLCEEVDNTDKITTLKINW